MWQITRSLSLMAFLAIALPILPSKSWAADLPAGQDVPFVDGSLAITGMVVNEGGEPVIGIGIVAVPRLLIRRADGIF